MRHVKRPPTPAELKGPKSKGSLERRAAEVFYGTAANRKKAYPGGFKAYKLEGIRKALEEAFGGKCAYCESVYDATAPVDVEHYRPKGGYMLAGGELQSPGYYWLAADWSNLLPSCIDCNRRRKQKARDGTVRLAGKANLFPLADEAARAKRPGGEKREKPLLLNPCVDRPEKHLVFDEEGYVDPARRARGALDPKGRESIEVYGLDRDPLIRGRQRVLKQMKLQLSNFKRVAAMLDDDPDNPELATLLRDMWAQIEASAEPSAEYSEMARQVIARWKRDFVG